MELREWLIILGLALVSLIVIDGIRRLQRQRRVPRLDQAAGEKSPYRGKAQAPDEDPEQAERDAELRRELPNGGARVLRPADYSGLSAKPNLERQEHPGPSKVLSEFRRSKDTRDPARADTDAEATPGASTSTCHTEPTLSIPPAKREGASAEALKDEALKEKAFGDQMNASRQETRRRQLRSDIAGEHSDTSFENAQDNSQDNSQDNAQDNAYSDDHFRLVDFDGIKHSFKERMADHHRVKQQKKEEKARRAQALAQQKAVRKAQEEQPRPEAKANAESEAIYPDTGEADEAGFDHDVNGTVHPHPTLEKALRHDVYGGHARKTLTNAEEVIVISVMSRSEEGFDGGTLLELLMVCGLRYSRGMGIFHRFETESPDSNLQFSMVNVVKPGSFPIEDMDEFVTPGVTFLMPLPGAEDSSAAFEAMVETAMVVVRHLGGELKDENHSVMTAQTIEFARQRVHEFERLHRLHQHLQAH